MAQAGEKVVVGVPLWGGGEYVQQFRNLSFASLMAPGNLPTAKHEFDISWQFWTDSQTLGALRQFVSSGALGPVSAEINVIDGLENWRLQSRASKYHVASLMLEEQVASEPNDYILIWNFADFLWPDSSLVHMLNKVPGDRAISDLRTVVGTVGIPIQSESLDEYRMYDAPGEADPSRAVSALRIDAQSVLTQLRRGSCGDWLNRHIWRSRQPGYRSFAYFQTNTGIAIKLFDIHPLIFCVNDSLRSLLRAPSRGTLDGFLLPHLQAHGYDLVTEFDLSTGALVVPSSDEHEAAGVSEDYFADLVRTLLATTYSKQKVSNFLSYTWFYEQENFDGYAALKKTIAENLKDPEWKTIESALSGRAEDARRRTNLLRVVVFRIVMWVFRSIGSVVRSIGSVVRSIGSVVRSIGSVGYERSVGRLRLAVRKNGVARLLKWQEPLLARAAQNEEKFAQILTYAPRSKVLQAREPQSAISEGYRQN